MLPDFLSGGGEMVTLRCQRLHVFNKLSANVDACLLPGLWLSPEDSGMLDSVDALRAFMLGEEC